MPQPLLMSRMYNPASWFQGKSLACTTLHEHTAITHNHMLH